jgi:membrane associated rhomboid family serine protease
MVTEERHGDEARESVVRRLKAAPVTVAILGVCVLAFASTVGVCAMRAEAAGADASAVLVGSWLQLEACGETLDTMGALRLADLWLDGAWWRVITAGLLHGSWLHLALNGWSLWVVGEWVEAAWGHLRAALLFAVSSVAGCLASAAWVEAPMVVGASAGIMGMAGALLVGRVLGRGALATKLRPVSAGMLGGCIVVLVALGFFVEVIAQAGHLGGLVAGSSLGLAWCGRGVAWTVGGSVALAGMLGGSAFGAARPEGRPRHDELLGLELLERGLDAEAAAMLERALAQRPEDAALANGVAYALAKAGTELERAEVLVRMALASEPENADYLDTLGWVLCRQGQPEAGMVELRKASVASKGEVAEIEQHLVDCEGAAVGGVPRETPGG